MGVHRRSRMLVGLGVGIVVVIASGVTIAIHGHGKDDDPLVSLRVRAVLTYSHPVNGVEQTVHAPMSGYRMLVSAAGTASGQISADIDKQGFATVALKPGRYLVTTSLAQACQPLTVDLVANHPAVKQLACIAP